MRIAIALSLLIIISCNTSKERGIKISKVQEDSAIAVAKRFLKSWYDSTYLMDDAYMAYPESMKNFLIFPKRLCKDNIEYKLDQLRESASDTNSLIHVTTSLYTYDLFQKKQVFVGTADVSMDTTCRVALIHCDSGLIFRQF